MLQLNFEWFNDFMSFYNWAINNGWLLIPAPCGCCYGPASIDDIDKAMKAQELEENL